MRKFAILAVALVTALAVAATAIAQSTGNSYNISNTSITPAKAGSKKKPLTVGEKFTYQVTGPNSQAPSAVNKYRIDAYGVRSNGKYFPKCTYGSIVNNGSSDTKCPSGSKVGDGLVISDLYFANPATFTSCKKSLKLYNGGQNALVLYLYGPASDCGGVGQSFVINAKFTKGSGGGQVLSFTVPPNILHPVPGATTAVTSTTSHIFALSKKSKGKKHGFLESVSCLGKHRPFVVSFVTESGQKTRRAASLRCRK